MASRKKVTIDVLSNGFVVDYIGSSSIAHPRVIKTFEELATELWSLLGEAHNVGDRADLIVTRSGVTTSADKIRKH